MFREQVVVCALWVRNIEAEHAAHEEHLKHENGGKLPEPPAYEYLNVRSAYLVLRNIITVSTFDLQTAHSLGA